LRVVIDKVVLPRKKWNADAEKLGSIKPDHGRYLASTSGLLCRSTIWEAKFSKHIAAVRVERMAARYGASETDCKFQYHASMESTPYKNARPQIT
jgi:hypothetical protein